MRKRHWWVASRLLLFILLGVALATVVITARFWWQQPANRPTSGTATPEAMKEKLEAYDKRADELEKLLELLLGVSTIYAVALGLSAYQQLKDSADKLEDLSKDAQKKIDELPAEIETIKKSAKVNFDEFVIMVKSRFPLFADMDYAIREIMDRLMLLLPVIDWSDENYRTLSAQLKEEILFYEKTVAALECFDLRGTRHIQQTISEIYHGLGNFYGLRYASVNKRSKDSADKLKSLREAAEKEIHEPDIAIPEIAHRLLNLPPAVYWGDEDKERARFYLDRSIHHNPENSGAYNDRGFLAANLDDPPDYQTARAVFSKSLAVDAEQQRARYNLAYIEHAAKNYGRSVELLTEALEKKWWQGKLAPRHRPSILYNRACGYARLGESDTAQRQAWFSKAVADLREVYPVGVVLGPELPMNFKADIEPGEDLHPLTMSEPWKSAIEEIKGRLP
jgi:tetratricopeptide (TPR) repeat protein